MQGLVNWFLGLAPRERRVLLIGSATGAAVLLLGILLPFERHVARLEQRVETRRADLAWLQSVAPQLGVLRASAPAAGGTSLVVLVDRVARETGIARALTSQSSGGGALSVRVEQVAFDSLLNWAAALVQRHGVRVMSASIDAGNNPGLVSASFVLAPP
ncbi:MAG TPA: type II secretion system protein M [Steroidobacteraceae bacterium]|nr:type II secretion system protein M [Steroidobacteraceae bacterium]